MVKAKTKKSPKAKVQTKSISNKKKAKNHKKMFWQVVSVALTAIALILIIAIISTYISNQSKEGFSDDGYTNLIIIHDPDCLICNVDLFSQQVQANLIPELKVTKIDINTPEANLFASIIGASFLPIYMFDSKIEERSDWEQMKSSFSDFNYEGVSYHILSPNAVEFKASLNKIPILENAIVIGDENAPITVYEFTDYECEFCAIAEGNEELVSEFHKRVPEYMPPVPNLYSEYIDSGVVKLVFYNYPVSDSHPLTSLTHNAALCANEQERWSDYHNVLIEKRKEWKQSEDREKTFNQFASDLELDTDEFSQCLEEERYELQIASEIQLGVVYGVRGTPAFFIEKNFIPGAQDFTTFKQIIELELNR